METLFLNRFGEREGCLLAQSRKFLSKTAAKTQQWTRLEFFEGPGKTVFTHRINAETQEALHDRRIERRADVLEVQR